MSDQCQHALMGGTTGHVAWPLASYQLKSPSGAKVTPRSTSRALALRMVKKWPRYPSPVGRVASLTRSVTFTNLLGSAPVSPFALIVEVMAKMVTVPSKLWSPAMLRQPPVAGLIDA